MATRKKPAIKAVLSETIDTELTYVLTRPMEGAFGQSWAAGIHVQMVPSLTPGQFEARHPSGTVSIGSPKALTELFAPVEQEGLL